MRFILLLTLLSALLFSQSVEFTEAERAFLEEKKTLTVGVDTTWFGFDAISMEGEHSGISSDYVKLISELTDLKIDYIARSDPGDLISLLEAGEVDLLPAVFYTKKRSASILYTEPYISLPFYIFSRDDDPHYGSLDKLIGSRVAAPRGYMILEWLQTYYPGINVVPSYSIYDGLEMAYRNQVSAFINDYPSTSSVLENSFLPDMGVNAPVSQLSHVQLHMAVRDELPILKDIIDKINSSMPEKDVKEIRAKWLSKGRLSMLNFSKKEREWIDRHKELTFASDPAWLPFEGYDRKTMQFFGISNDILQLISERTSLNFKLVDNGSWEEVQRVARNGEVQLLPAVTPTNELGSFLQFSKPYIEVPFVLFGDESSGHISSMSDIKNRRVAIIENSYIHKELAQKYQEIDFVPLKNKSELLESVIDGRSDFFIDNLASSSYALNQHHIKDIVGLLELPYMYKPSLGLSKDLGDVGLSVINKAIDSLTDEELQNIYNKWVFTERVKSSSLLSEWYLQVGLIFIGLVLLSLLYLRYRFKSNN